MYEELPEYFNVAAHFLEAPAASHPERPAIVGEPGEVTCGELAALANRTGNALRAQGICRGERVLIVLPDSAEFVAAFFGAAKIGAVAVPVNPFARSSDYIHYLENSQPGAAIVHSDLGFGGVCGRLFWCGQNRRRGCARESLCAILRLHSLPRE